MGKVARAILFFFCKFRPKPRNCPQNKCALLLNPERRSGFLRILPSGESSPPLGNPCGSCRVCAHVLVLHAPQLPHWGGREGKRACYHGYLRAISPQTQGRFTVFLLDWSRRERAIRIHRRVISPQRYFNADACERGYETMRHAVITALIVQFLLYKFRNCRISFHACYSKTIFCYKTHKKI